MNEFNTSALTRSAARDCFRVRANRQKGVALIVSLVIIVLLTLLAVTGLRTSIVEEQVSGNQKLAAMSLFAGEQGVSQAVDDLFDGTISDSGNEDDVSWTTGWLSGTGTGYSFDYRVSHLLTADGALVENDDGRAYFLIESVGHASGEARRLLEVAIAVELDDGANVAGLIGCQGVTGSSNVKTSSYSSSGAASTGDRGDVATTDASALMYWDASSDFDVNGDVRSTGYLYMKSDTLIQGDALATLGIRIDGGDVYGSAYTNGTCSSCSVPSEVHGSVYQGPTVSPNPIVPTVECDPWDIDAIFDEADDIKTSNNNAEIGISSGGNYSGSPVTIGVSGASKDYYFNNFTLDGDETTQVTGDVRIYVYNDFTMKSNVHLILGPDSSLKIYVETGNAWIDSNSMVNHDPDDWFPDCSPGGCPINVYLYSKHEDTVKDYKNGTTEPHVWDDSQDNVGVKIDSNSVFYGITYAPLSNVVLYSNAEIYGSVRGRQVTTSSNLAFHYDEDLDNLWVGLPGDYKLVYWTEQYPE
jgi:hypothetical protein